MWNMDALVLIGFCDSDYASLRRESRIPFVVLAGENEIAQGKVTLKNMESGEQTLVSAEELIAAIQK